MAANNKLTQSESQVESQDLSRIESTVWDFVIVGTGMGGGAFGLRMAQAGHSVLFIEKGKAPSASGAIKGQFAETYVKNEGEREDIMKRAGRRTEAIFDRSGRRAKKLTPFLGSGVGGSSALYGAVLERFQPVDFEKWPISARDMAPHYDLAERLF
ncbi:MAG: hypothetical protein NDI61_12660, partial [Bdellovibrionaceae bacterium]|nr:hypothetical protein [Pseudobdellovibrionaceae bacterium]